MMVRSAVVASSPLAILRSNHARSTSARDVEGDSVEGRGALRYRAHSQLRDFPSSRSPVRTARSVPQSHSHNHLVCLLMRVARPRTTQRPQRRPVRS